MALENHPKDKDNLEDKIDSALTAMDVIGIILAVNVVICIVTGTDELLLCVFVFALLLVLVTIVSSNSMNKSRKKALERLSELENRLEMLRKELDDD